MYAVEWKFSLNYEKWVKQTLEQTKWDVWDYMVHKRELSITRMAILGRIADSD